MEESRLPRPSKEALEKKPLKQGELMGVTPRGVIVHLPQAEATYQLPPAIYAVWSRCDGQITVSEIASQLSKETDIPIEKMQAIVYVILTTLAEHQLITW